MYKLSFGMLVGAACALASNQAYAARLAVVVSEIDQAGTSRVVASWTQDQNPVPIAYVDDYYTTVPIYDPVGLGADMAITWYSSTHLGGFTNYNQDFNMVAPTSYTFVDNAPVFIPGMYRGVDIKPDFSYRSASYTITALPEARFQSTPALSRLDAPTPAIPESATWAMMLTGLGMIGFAARVRVRPGQVGA